MKIKVKDNVDLSILLKGFKENDNSYDLDSMFDEFISVDKTTREVKQYGYNGLLIDWYQQGLIELL